jgi:hypothetical protein
MEGDRGRCSWSHTKSFLTCARGGLYPGDMGRYGEIWGDMGRHGEIWGDTAGSSTCSRGGLHPLSWCCLSSASYAECAGSAKVVVRSWLGLGLGFRVRVRVRARVRELGRGALLLTDGLMA